MKISADTWIRAALVAGGVLMGTGGTLLSVPNKPDKPVTTQVIEIKPNCPDIFLDNVKIKPSR